MPWASIDELYKAYGLAIAIGLLLGAVVVIVNNWRG